MDITVVGVIGAGTIGSGVAQSLAETGHRVLLVDSSAAQLDRSLERIRRNLRLFGFFPRNGARPPVEDVMERIRCSTRVDALAPAEFIVENVTEKWDVKEPLYRAIDDVCPAGTPFAANTSAIPITRYASVTRRPAQVVGLHFMNPVPLMPTVEVIRGFHTASATIDTALGLLRQMGKDGVVVNDSPGFVTNRVMMLMVNEAVFLLHEGVASAEEIDRLFRTCFGHKMGPLETADLIGLDTVLYSIEVLQREFGDDKYRPCPLLRRMVDAGRLGKKTAVGFHDYRTVTTAPHTNDRWNGGLQ